ncbi:MAG: GGDEF domain-containing protein [Thiothrix sp.]|nr:MAG: GGDEF domain-containing protein [Thiothrix sp.]
MMLKLVRHLQTIYQWLLVPLSLVLIYASAMNLISTFFTLEKYRYETLWSVEHLSREIEKTIYESQLYLANASPHHQLHAQYKLLNRRLSIVRNHLTQDPNISMLPDLDLILSKLTVDLQSMDQAFSSERSLDQTRLNQWISALEDSRENINRYLIYPISAGQNRYASAAWQALLNAMLIVGLAILLLLLTIGHLIYVLMQEQTRQRNQLEKDTLTSLYSRQFIMSKLHELCQKRIDFCIVFLDLNKFKTVNDNYGHQTGDQLLIYVAEQLQTNLEKLGPVGRIGGDEFLWLIPHAEQDKITQQYSQLTQALSIPLQIHKQQVPVSLSAGAVLASACDYDPSQALDYGDTAMYWAKTTQSTSIVWYGEINHSKTVAASIG